MLLLYAQKWTLYTHLRCCNTLTCQITFSLNCYFKNLSSLLSLEQNQPQDLWAMNFYNSPKVCSPILGLRGSLLMAMHQLSLSTQTKMPRMAFSCQLCPSEHGVTGCLLQHLQSQERGDSFVQSREYPPQLQSTGGPGNFLRPAAVEANFGWIGPLLLMHIRPQNKCQEIVHMQKGLIFRNRYTTV